MMLVYAPGASYYLVIVSAREVQEFKATWPCSDLPDCSVAFEFSRSNGDLVDVTADKPFDGPAAVALADDAMRHGARKLGLSLNGRIAA